MVHDFDFEKNPQMNPKGCGAMFEKKLPIFSKKSAEYEFGNEKLIRCS